MPASTFRNDFCKVVPACAVISFVAFLEFLCLCCENSTELGYVEMSHGDPEDYRPSSGGSCHVVL